MGRRKRAPAGVLAQRAIHARLVQGGRSTSEPAWLKVGEKPRNACGTCGGARRLEKPRNADWVLHCAVCEPPIA